jgi:hypothetical protein
MTTVHNSVKRAAEWPVCGPYGVTREMTFSKLYKACQRPLTNPRIGQIGLLGDHTIQEAHAYVDGHSIVGVVTMIILRCKL